jgi:hypothetical protein
LECGGLPPLFFAADENGKARRWQATALQGFKPPIDPISAYDAG